MHNLWIEFSTVAARLGFKRRSTAVLKSNLIRRSFSSARRAVARRLKRALHVQNQGRTQRSFM